MVPEDAWLKGSVNAVVHRSYSLAGDHIRVDIFDDWMEIHSPGRLPGIVDLADPREAPRLALAQFYSGPGAKYGDAAASFFRQHPGLEP